MIGKTEGVNVGNACLKGYGLFCKNKTVYNAFFPVEYDTFAH